MHACSHHTIVTFETEDHANKTCAGETVPAHTSVPMLVMLWVTAALLTHPTMMDNQRCFEKEVSNNISKIHYVTNM
jgi:hypothetical protein